MIQNYETATENYEILNQNVDLLSQHFVTINLTQLRFLKYLMLRKFLLRVSLWRLEFEHLFMYITYHNLK